MSDEQFEDGRYDDFSAPKFKEPEPLWKNAKVGKPRHFETPEDMWEAATAYFQWCVDNPMYEEKVFHAKGMITRTRVPKVRPFTMAGFCIHANISNQSYYDYRNREEYSGVCDLIAQTMYEQKFTGATNDLMNPAIIARDLGLKDQQHVTTSVTEMTDEELDRRVAELMKAAGMTDLPVEEE